MFKSLTMPGASRFALLAGAGIAALASSSPAFAQTAEENQVTASASDCIDENGDGVCDISSADGTSSEAGIVVTGSRIARPNLESQTPVTVISGEQIFDQGSINVGDTLNNLPQLRSTFSQSNAGRFLGTTGLNLLDLRGLGTVRTLTLVNGRRHVPSDILSNGTSTDINTIPNDLIERVDVVTGANSAIYGSDAIAGVVNFILRDDFDGLQLRGHVNVNGDGNFPGQYVSAMAGQNFADGRGNVLLHAEYANQQRVYGSDVDWLRQQGNFLIIDSDTALPNGSDNFPDRAFFSDVRSASIHPYSLVFFPQSTTNPACGRGLGTSNGAPAATGTPYNCTFIFTANGQLVPQTGTRGSTGPIGSIVGGNGATTRESTLLTVMPSQERINVNLLAHFELSPAFVPFVEAKYVNIKTQGQNSSPAFVQGGTYGDSRERPRLDNPFLDPAARDIITAQLLASGMNSNSLTARTALTPAQLAAIADGSYRFGVARYLLDLGNRDERSEREVYRIVAGVRGEFLENFRYEASVNYGQVKEDTTILGNIIPQRFILAMDAVRNSSGQIVCRSQLNPSDPNNIYGLPGDEEALQADIANCVPYNPFGAADNSAAAAYILEDTVSHAKLDQLVVSAFVSGDTTSFFTLPGGPVGFALGAEYRRESLFYQADPIVEAGRTFYNALPTFDPEPFEVKEAFAELRIPLLRDLPFVEEFSISGAARVSDYGGAVGTVWAYNAGAEWQVIPDLRFRGQYGRSVRAPNLTETAFPLSQNFASFSDPCLPQNRNNNPNRAANCAADLGALLNDPQFVALPTYSLDFWSGSNPDLKEETSDSYTIGAVFTPSFVPGLSITADYFDIRVNDVITSVGAQTLVNTCYDLPSLDNPFCALITRFRGPGLGPNDEVPGQVLDKDLVVAGVNFAARTTRGFDVDLSYGYSFGEDSRLSTRFIYTHLFERSNFENPTTPEFENRILSELGDPEDEFRWSVDLKAGQFGLGYTMQYIGPMFVSLYEDVNELPGACTPAGCPPNNADYADILEYPATFYHDVRLSFEFQEGGEFTLGVDNVLDTNPPLGLTGVGEGSGIYRVRGRNFYAGFVARF